MYKLNIGVCDDEKIMIKLLENIIKIVIEKNETEAEIFTFTAGREIIDKAENLDIVFLDIEMSGIDGYETAKLINKINPSCKIIMASSHVERFQEAFMIKATRFILKPFKKSEIEEALEATIRLDVGKEKIELYENRVAVQIEQRQIYYMVSYDSYTEFVLKDRVLRKNISLSELEDYLDSKIFFRIHRKMIVNMLFIQEYKNGRIKINKDELQVARRKKKEFEKAYIECDLKYK